MAERESRMPTGKELTDSIERYFNKYTKPFLRKMKLGGEDQEEPILEPVRRGNVISNFLLFKPLI